MLLCRLNIDATCYSQSWTSEPQLCHDPDLTGTLFPGEALLTPTKIYRRSLLPALRSGAVRACAHITGGGLLENIPRVLPQELAADIGERKDYFHLGDRPPV